MRNIFKIALLMLLLTSADLSVAASSPAQVPVTGETGGSAAGSGVAWPNPRFVVGRGASESCITDKLTGLMWVKDLNTVVIKDSTIKGSYTTWQNALVSIKSVNNSGGYCGYTDWRLPNVTELKSLVNYSQQNQSGWLKEKEQGFANVRAGLYWSSTSYAPSTSNAWYVAFTNGAMDMANKNNNHSVWPVRGGK